MKINRPEVNMPVELKREWFFVLAGEVKREVRKRGLTEKDIARDFESWRRNRRALLAGR